MSGNSEGICLWGTSNLQPTHGELHENALEITDACAPDSRHLPRHRPDSPRHMSALREPEEARKARQEAARKLMTQHDAELRAVLNDAQYEKWEQQRRDMKKKWQQNTGEMRNDGAAP